MSLAAFILLAGACLLTATVMVALAVRVVTARAPARRPRRPVGLSGPQRRLLAERRRHHDPDTTDVLPRLNADGSPAWPDIDPHRRLPTDHDH